MTEPSVSEAAVLARIGLPLTKAPPPRRAENISPEAGS